MTHNQLETVLAAGIVVLVFGVTWWWLGFRKKRELPQDLTETFAFFSDKHK